MATDGIDKTNLTGDFVFADVIDKICCYLNLVALYKVAQVSKSWNAAAKKELGSRGLQRISMCDYHDLITQRSFHSLKVEPRVVLFFVPHNKICDEEIFDEYFTDPYKSMENCAKTTVLIGSSRIYTEESFKIESEEYDDGTCYYIYRPPQIHCLVIPKHDKLDVNYVYYTAEQIKEKSFNHETAIHCLIPTNEQAATFLLLFVCFESEFLKKSLNSIKDHFERNNCALWGSELWVRPLLDNSENGIELHDQEMKFIGISISSVNMNLFSTVFSCTNISITGFYQDLMKFKNDIKLKRNSMAFVSGPWFREDKEYYSDMSVSSDSSDSRGEEDKLKQEYCEREYVFNFTKVFPGVPIISLFQHNTFHSFGIDRANGKYIKIIPSPLTFHTLLLEESTND